MASFMENLWLSIFTPGPTPTLLLATNIAFAALQVLLLGLFIATYSIHFVVLSFLCASLWWSINWFSAELGRETAREKAETAEKDAKVKEGGGSDMVGSDTETESVSGGGAGEGVGEKLPPPRPVEGGSATGLRPDEGGVDAVRRRRSLGDSSGYVSTDSEWEKVDEGDEKDR